MATARTIAERVYRLLNYGHEYVRQGTAASEEHDRKQLVNRLARTAAELGYRLERRAHAAP